MREAALAYQITRKWSKERILRNYLNTIYFGNGAYGIESAARTYFGNNHPSCGESGAPMCAQVLAPEEAATLAGLVASPSGYDPLQHRAASKRRRDLVLQRMVEQGYLSPVQYREAKLTSLPTSRDVEPPNEDTKYPYFTSWIKQQVVDRLGGGQQGARRAFEGGLAVRTTLDSRLQDAAQNAINQWLPWTGGPRASLVAIKNDTGEVLAMVGGDDYAEKPFNLATQGQRQPGSAFKPFVLAEALTQGISPESTWASQKTEFCVVRKKGRCIEAFKVNNYENSYAGVRTLRNATTFSDNSVYAQVGIKAGTGKVARRARRMGIRTPVSKNMAITLGGLKQGVTPLDMAHAYETLAERGRLTYGTMSPGSRPRKRRVRPPVPGPVGIQRISRKGDDKRKPVDLPNGAKAINRTIRKPVLQASVADTVTSILTSVVDSGTATRAQIAGQFAAGKTGTTENYGDAWFVGWNSKITVAVWVGYPDKLIPMRTEFSGQPVAGGTFPAGIWRTFVEAAMGLGYKPKEPKEPELETPVAPGTVAPAPAQATPAPQAAAPAAPAPETPAPDDAGPHDTRAGRARGAGAGHPAARAADGAAGDRRRRAGLAARARPTRLRRRRASGRCRPAARSAAGHGRETLREPVAQKRQGSSAALVIPMRVPATISGASQPGGRGPARIGPRTRSVALSSRSMPSACVSFPGPEHSCSSACDAAPLAHGGDAGHRLERADQHRRARALGLAHRVDERMDAVGPVHVRRARAAEEHVRARGQADMGVARRLGLVVGLGLDDHAGAAPVRERAADQVARDLDHRARVELAREHYAGWTSSSARAWLSCSRTRASAVPPSDTLDSSHSRCASTA